MENFHLSEKRERLLEILGRNPDESLDELARLSGFKNKTYLPRVTKQLKEKGYLSQPFYEVEYRTICRNRLTLVAVVVLFTRNYEEIMALFKKIDSYLRFYPIFEQSFKKFIITFLASDVRKVKEIMDYLVKKGIIHYYDFYRQDVKYALTNPAFRTHSGIPAPSVPSLDNLLEETDICDLTWKKYSGLRLNHCDLSLLMNLEAGTGECKLSAIQQYERTVRKNSFSYAQLKESFAKLTREGIVKKKYYVYPIPKEKCFRFILLVRSDDFEKTGRLVFNFGKHARLQKSVTYWISYTDRKIFGLIQCICDPLFLIDVLKKLDTYREIREKKFYFLRSYPLTYWSSQSITTDYYDYKTQTLYYPYQKYFSEIREEADSLLR